MMRALGAIGAGILALVLGMGAGALARPDAIPDGHTCAPGTSCTVEYGAEGWRLVAP